MKKKFKKMQAIVNVSDENRRKSEVKLIVDNLIVLYAEITDLNNKHFANCLFLIVKLNAKLENKNDALVAVMDRMIELCRGRLVEFVKNSENKEWTSLAALTIASCVPSEATEDLKELVEKGTREYFSNKDASDWKTITDLTIHKWMMDELNWQCESDEILVPEYPNRANKNLPNLTFFFYYVTHKIFEYCDYGVDENAKLNEKECDVIKMYANDMATKSIDAELIAEFLYCTKLMKWNDDDIQTKLTARLMALMKPDGTFKNSCGSFYDKSHAAAVVLFALYDRI